MLGALVGAHAPAQADPPDGLDGLRASIDERLPDRESEQAPRHPDEAPPGRIPVYEHPAGSGAGQTGYVSTNVLRPNRKAGAAAPPNSTRPHPSRLQSAPAPQMGSQPAGSPNGAPRPNGVSAPNRAAALSGNVPRAARVPALSNRDIAGPLARRRLPPVDEDPFAPVGVRAGAFLLRPALELTGGYDSNPARVTGGRGSSLLIVAPELKLNSDWERHALTINLRGSYTDYPSVPFADQPFADAKIDGRIDVSRDTRLDLEARYLLSTENPGSPNLQAGLAKLPIYTDVGGTIGVDQRFNRLELLLKGTIDRLDYQNSLLTDGSSVSNQDRNYDQYGVQARTAYELTPGLKPFVELDADTRVHDLPVDQYGYARDSDGVTPKVGTTFEITRKLTGEVSVGYLVRTYKDPRLADLQGLIANASLVWNATGLTEVKLTATSTADESILPGVSGLFRRDAGIEVDHAFRRWLIGTFKVGWGLDDYVGLNREDKRYAASLGIVYKLSRTMQLKGELREALLRSNVPGVDYTATAILVGLRFQR